MSTNDVNVACMRQLFVYTVVSCIVCIHRWFVHVPVICIHLWCLNVQRISMQRWCLNIFQIQRISMQRWCLNIFQGSVKICMRRWFVFCVNLWMLACAPLISLCSFFSRPGYILFCNYFSMPWSIFVHASPVLATYSFVTISIVTISPCVDSLICIARSFFSCPGYLLFCNFFSMPWFSGLYSQRINILRCSACSC